jgi:hypothetical protein
MATQSKVTASLSADVKADILSKLDSIKKSMDFLISLQPRQIKSMLKSGNGYAAFIEKAYNVANEHPEILPGLFGLEEFRNGYQLGKDLTAIGDSINQLADSMRDTRLAVNSDALNFALAIYSSVKQNKSRLPGGNVIADEMKEFFKKSKRSILTRV